MFLPANGSTRPPTQLVSAGIRTRLAQPGIALGNHMQERLSTDGADALLGTGNSVVNCATADGRFARLDKVRHSTLNIATLAGRHKVIWRVIFGVLIQMVGNQLTWFHSSMASHHPLNNSATPMTRMFTRANLVVQHGSTQQDIRISVAVPRPIARGKEVIGIIKTWIASSCLHKKKYITNITVSQVYIPGM